MDKQYKMYLTQMVEQYMADNNLKAVDMARLLGCNQSTISRWIHGKTNVGTFKYLARLKRLYRKWEPDDVTLTLTPEQWEQLVWDEDVQEYDWIDEDEEIGQSKGWE